MHYLRRFRNEDPKHEVKPLWFIECLVSNVVENRIYQFIAILTMLGGSLEFGLGLMFVVRYSDFDMFANFATMFFTAFHTNLALVPFLLQRKTFAEVRRHAQLYFWKIQEIEPEAVKELKRGIRTGKMVHIVSLMLCCPTPILLLPYRGVDYNSTEHTVIMVLPYLKLPIILQHVLAAFYHMLLFGYGYFIFLYLLNWTYMILTYKLEVIILKWKIINITKELERKLTFFDIIGNTECQIVIKQRLKTWVKDHIQLRVFAKMVINSVKVSLFFHVFSGIILITTLSYILLLHNGGTNPGAMLLELIGALYLATFYAIWAEIFSYQNELLHEAISAAPWNCFDKGNSMTTLIMYCNLGKRLYLSAGDIFVGNFQLYVWVLEKVVNLLSALKLMDQR